MKKLGRNTIILFSSTILVNVGNYLLNLFLARLLGPEYFAEVMVLATGVVMLSFIALAFQLAATRFVAQDDSNENESASNVIALLRQWAMAAGIIMGSILILFVHNICNYLHLSSVTAIVLIAISIPFYLVMSINRGVAQGSEKFGLLAGSYIVEMVVRVGVTLILVVGLAGIWDITFMTAVAIGFLLSFIAPFAIPMAIAPTQNKTPFVLKKRVRNYLLGIGVYELSQILINHSDVFLVKHFFDPREAGLYAGIALIGKVVYFATWSIVNILFPRVVQLEKEGKPHHGLFWLSFGIVMTIGLTIVAGAFIFPKWIIMLTFGEDYISVAPLLGWYALSTVLFSCANVFAYYFLSLGKYFPVYASMIIGLTQIVLITKWHANLEAVIQVQIALMIVLTLLYLGYYLYQMAQSYAKSGVEKSSEPQAEILAPA